MKRIIAAFAAGGSAGLTVAILGERVGWSRSAGAVHNWIDRRRGRAKPDEEAAALAGRGPVTYTERPERCRQCGSGFLPATEDGDGWRCVLCGTVHYRAGVLV